MSFEEILADPEVVGLPCAEGVDYVIAGLDAAGFPTDVLINFHTVMGSGLEKMHPEKLQDGSGIDHLSDEFFETVEPLIGAAFGICAA